MQIERSKADETEDYVRGGTQRARYDAEDVVRWACPLCAETEGELLKTERGALGVFVCKKCDLIRINPRLKQPDEVYRGDASIYEEEFREVVRGRRAHHRDPNYLYDLSLIEQYKPTGNFLDIGTNTGSFLRLARNRGWKLTGVEPSPQLGALARRWWGLEILEGFVENVALPERHFDVVTMTDVFEHVSNPREVLSAIRRVLRPDGLLFVKVPNALFNLLKFRARSLLRKQNTDDFDSYEHVLHYTDVTLKKMLASCGFDPFRITVERPIQTPVWHKLVGHYYQHASPFVLDWPTRSSRNLLYRAAVVENAVSGRVGWLAPNIGCFARPALS